MNEFANDFRELLQLANTTRQKFSSADLAERLNRFSELCKDHYSSEAVERFKLELLRHLFRVILTVQKRDDKCSIIHSLKTILKTCTVDDVELFIYLYNSVVYQIYDENDRSISEEMKLEVLEFLIELLKRSTKRILQLLYNEKYAAHFSMGVHVAGRIAGEEKSFKLRVTALDFLLHSMQYYQRNDKVLQSVVGELFMLYLPGLIKRLGEIILRDEIQQHIITVKAISCWGQLLCTVMKDIDDEEEVTHEEMIKSWLNHMKEGKEKEILIEKKILMEKVRSKKWLEAAAHSLKPFIERVTQVRKHSQKKVRLELVTQISNIIDNCLMSLRSSIAVMVEVLISSSEDEEEEVCHAAEFAIARFENKCRCKNGDVFLEYLQDNLDFIITSSLPHAALCQDEKAILNVMQSFCGILKILQNSQQYREIFNFSSNLTRFFRVLVMVSHLELHEEISAQDYSVGDEEVNPPLWTKSWKRFKYFTSEKIASKLTEAFGLLARISDAATVLDYLIDQFKGGGPTRNEVLLIVNEILGSRPDMDDDTVRHFLDVYLDPDYLRLQLEVDDDRCLNVGESRMNIITVTLLMEGIGAMSRTIGGRFQGHLLKSLYVVIEKMGSGYRIIRTAATQTASEISKSIGLAGDVHSLIKTNVDYLTYHITLKLRRNDPSVFDVVSVLIRNSSFDSMTDLEEIIMNVLNTSSRAFNSPHTTSYLRLYRTFLGCLRKWKGRSDYVTDEINERKPEKDEMDSFIEFVVEKEKKTGGEEDAEGETEPEENRTEGEGENGDVEEEEEEEEEELTENKPKNLPKDVELTVKIAEDALNHLPSGDVDKKLLVLEILIEAVIILSDRENELLPIIHKIWSPLMTQFDKVTDALLINRSFALLYVMTRTSKDFIRRRTLKSVLPPLRGFLSKSAEKSKSKNSGSGYHYTQIFKLQKELLSKLGILVVDLRLTGKETDSITECCLPYLSSLQPLPLQENCRKLFMILKDHDPYLVWYKVKLLENETEFSKNVEIILQHIIS